MSANAYQRAVVAALDAAAGLAGVTITAHPVPDQALPFVTIAGGEAMDEVDDPWLAIELHTWSAAEGGHEVQSMQSAIYDALHSQTIELDDWRFVNIRQVYSTHFLDIGGETWHGVQRFRTLSSRL